MTYLDILQRHGLLLAVVVVLGGSLAATNTDMLGRFESLRFGPVEAKLRALSLKGRSAREVDAKEVGKQVHQQETLDLWRPVSTSSDRNLFIEKARIAAQIAGSRSFEGINAFDAFRKGVVTPLAELDGLLLSTRIDLFEAGPASSYLLETAVRATDPVVSDDARIESLCVSATALLYIIEGRPDWVKAVRPYDAATGSYASQDQVGAAVDFTRESVRAWRDRCENPLNREEMVALSRSPHTIMIVDTLFRRVLANRGDVDNLTTGFYMKQFGWDGKEFDATRLMLDRSYDLISRVVLVSLIHRASGDILSVGHTFRMLLESYLQVGSFAERSLHAPADRERIYSPCMSEKLAGDVDPETGLSQGAFCDRIEYVTLPATLNSVLFVVAGSWIKGDKVEPGHLNVSESLLPRAEVRLGMLQSRIAEAPSDTVIEGLYYALLDTVALTRLMLAVEMQDRPSIGQCRGIAAMFDDVVRYLERGAVSKSAALVVADLARLETLAAVRRRQEIADTYCAGD